MVRKQIAVKRPIENEKYLRLSLTTNTIKTSSIRDNKKTHFIGFYFHSLPHLTRHQHSRENVINHFPRRLGLRPEWQKNMVESKQGNQYERRAGRFPNANGGRIGAVGMELGEEDAQDVHQDGQVDEDGQTYRHCEDPT